MLIGAEDGLEAAERAEGRSYLAMAESGNGTLETQRAAEAVGRQERRASEDSIGAQTEFEEGVLLDLERKRETGRDGASSEGWLAIGAQEDLRETLSRNMVCGSSRGAANRM